MAVHFKLFRVKTAGFTDIIDLTGQVAGIVEESALQDGIVLVFVPGSTAGLTTIEFEDGALEDLKQAIRRLVPENISYSHDLRWGDGNGFSHVRASLIGPSLALPLTDGALRLGTWQQIVLIDFDNRPRDRQVTVTVFGD